MSEPSTTSRPERLTTFSKGAGCGCKIAPDVLERILEGTDDKYLPKELLVGRSSNDDAAVYDIGNGQAIISTTDVFTPIVDDAELFGRIAMVNALSDVYAMGGKPLMAIAILGWPVDKLPTELAQKVIEGGRLACEIAGIPLAGGHSIDTPEPLFGGAITGLVATDHIKRNSTARPGDRLFLTKPIGLGILSTAMKRGKLDPEHADIAAEVMLRPNAIGELLGSIPGVHAMTDITGFGLLGHLKEMCLGSGTTSTIYMPEVPVIPEARAYLDRAIYPDGTFRNWRAYGAQVKGADGQAMLLLSDPQTSGGLLVAVAPNAMQEVRSCFADSGTQAHHIGEMHELSSTRHLIEVMNG